MRDWIESWWAFRSPAKRNRVLAGFARAEFASNLDLQAAAAMSESPKRVALYLRHAADEARHARLFARRAELAHVDADWEELYERLGETRFLAFVHHGERRGCEQFEAFAKFLADRDPDLAQLFREILADEVRHRDYTWKLLVEQCGNDRAARRAIRVVRRWEAWRMFRRAGRAVADVVYRIAMAVLYLGLVPLGRLGSRRSLGELREEP